MTEVFRAILQHPQFPQNKFWWEEAFTPQQTILKEGEVSRDLYLIRKGIVRINMEVDIDAEHHMQSGLGELTSGDSFGELNLFGATARSASVVALSETQLIRIDGKALSEFMDRYPELGYPVMKNYFIEHAALLRTTNIKVSGLYAMHLRQGKGR